MTRRADFHRRGGSRGSELLCKGARQRADVVGMQADDRRGVAHGDRPLVPSMTPKSLEGVRGAPGPSVEHEGVREAAIAPVLLRPRMEFVSSRAPRAER